MLSTKDSVSILDSTAPSQHHVYALGELVGANVEALVQLHAKLGHMTFRRMVHLIKVWSHDRCVQVAGYLT
jgi:hypothetical protein